jgi:hypothetical protein
MRWAAAAALTGAVAACAAAPPGEDPGQCEPAPAPPIVLAVQSVTVAGDVTGLAPVALPLAHAALLEMQQRLRAGGGAGTARFLLRDVRLTEEAAPGADGIAPATRHEGWLRFAVELQGTAPPPVPVEGEARSVMLMVGHASPAERAWACQQIAHEAVARMGRELERQLAPWTMPR